MAEQNIQSKLVNQLRQDKIQLWLPPYTLDNGIGQEEMHALAVRYATVIGVPELDVEVALETIRSQAVKKGSGNKLFKEKSIATLEIHLPREVGKGKKHFLETRLDVPVQDIINRITQDFGLQYIKLILSGKTLAPSKKLEEAGVRNNSKVMVLKLSRPEEQTAVANADQKKRSQEESMKRTQKGFQILSERDGSEDPSTTPYLEIADQKGNPLPIPPSENKALILAMGFHEKGRALMKRKQYDDALCHLLEADSEFKKCNSTLLNTVDNYAVLQLDIVWCYRALQALSHLDDSRQRLQQAEDCFIKCYGDRQERLLQIKGSKGGEEVLYLRLYLLQSLLSYLEGNDRRARERLTQVEELYSRLRIDTEKVDVLLSMGFTDQEARLGLRACQGQADLAAEHIIARRKEKEELRKSERKKRRQRVDDISTLVGLGYTKKEAARALHQTNGDVDKAYLMLLESPQPMDTATSPLESDKQSQVDQMMSLGFDRADSEAALRLTDWDLAQATQLLLENQGSLPSELLPPSDSSASTSDSPPSISSPSEEPSTSSGSPGNASLDADLVNEVLEDIPQHEEDYLDLTLDEESELIAQLNSYLDRTSATSG